MHFRNFVRSVATRQNPVDNHDAAIAIPSSMNTISFVEAADVQKYELWQRRKKKETRKSARSDSLVLLLENDFLIKSSKGSLGQNDDTTSKTPVISSLTCLFS